MAVSALVQDKAMDSVLSASRRILLKEPYYAFMMLGLNKRISDAAPTAWVTTRGLAVELGVNPEFWDSLTEKQQEGTLVHELLHIAFAHITRWHSMTRKNPDVANIAMDIEVNQYIDKEKLINGACTLEYFNKELDLNMEPKAGCKYYFDILMEHSNEEKLKKLLGKMRATGMNGDVCNNGDGDGDGDGEGTDNRKTDKSSYEKKEFDPNGTPKMPKHDFSDPNKEEGSLSGSASQTGISAIEAQIASIMKQAAGRAAGNVPGHIKQAIEKLLPPKKKVIDWQTLFKMWVKGAESEDIKSTRMRLNKRNPLSPGFKQCYKVRMLAMIDTSGSVDDATLQKFLDLLFWAQKAGAKIDLLQFDHGIQDISKFDRNKPVEIYGRGGTEFQQPLDYYKEHRRNYDCAVFFTDGEASCPRSFATANLLWLIHSYYVEEVKRSSENFPGKKVYIDCHR